MHDHPEWLGQNPRVFPPTTRALKDPNGLLAIGGDLQPERLITAYSKGIFPWYSEDQPILWWTPEPRMVFTPGEVRQSKSLKKYLKKYACKVSIDRDFSAVINHCRQPRKDNNGTWISDDITQAYTQLHKLGIAHSIETRNANDQLIGGFYGVSIGAIFFGESMFSLQTNASKIAITQFSLWAKKQNFALIDCQVENPHLTSLGGKAISRLAFEAILRQHGASKVPIFQPLWEFCKGNDIFNNISQCQPSETIT